MKAHTGDLSMLRALLPALLAAPLMAGCISTVGKVVTAPVKVAGKAVDWTTTSQSESDENRGRALRKNEEQRGKLDKQYRKHRRDCEDGDEKSCSLARDDYDRIQALSSDY